MEFSELESIMTKNGLTQLQTVKLLGLLPRSAKDPLRYAGATWAQLRSGIRKINLEIILRVRKLAKMEPEEIAKELKKLG